MMPYINKENTLEAINKLKSGGVFSEAMKTAAIKTIENQPAADVVEVVRCKDCKKCDIRYPLKEIGKEAVIGYFCEMLNIYKSPTDFCSYGERKGDDTK